MINNLNKLKKTIIIKKTTQHKYNVINVKNNKNIN